MGGIRRTRIVVADSDARVRSALHTLLRQEPGHIIIEESDDAGALVARMSDFRPDLVLLDWELPGQPAAALLLSLHGLDYHPKVIVLSTRPEWEADALAAGADAFVCKGDPPERLLGALQNVLEAKQNGELDA